MQYLVSMIHKPARYSFDSTKGPSVNIARLGHRHRQPGRGGEAHRGALRGVEGVSGRLVDHRGRRPRRGAQARRRGAGGLQPEDRGAAVPVSALGVRAATAEAFAAAAGRWPAGGVPPSPGAWLTTTASRKDRKSTRLNSSHVEISYAVFCLKKKKKYKQEQRGTKKNKEIQRGTKKYKEVQIGTKKCKEV